MPQEQTFRSPDIYEREVDQSAPVIQGPVGVPAGVVGTANKGPAFVPVTVANFNEFTKVFGNLDPKKFGPYAVNEFLKHRSALTYLKVLGAGSNQTDADITATLTSGRVVNAGVKLEGNLAVDDAEGRHAGAVQFLVAKHSLQTNEAFGMPMFTDNQSFNGSTVDLVRGVVMMASGARMMVLDGTGSLPAATLSTMHDVAGTAAGKFKLIVSSTLGNSFSNMDGLSGVKVLTASMDPSSPDYFGKILNRDPDKFVEHQHFLYADFAVDDELATATIVGVLSGSARGSDSSGEKSTALRKAFGAYDTRYTAPASPTFISQPFGATEYDLFSFEALDDGEYANKLYKIAISNVKASVDQSNLYGTFTVEVRDWNDTDANPNVLERYPNCTLDPQSDSYVAKKIGDRKVTYNFDSATPTERRIISSGKYDNKSDFVRIVMADQVEKAIVPKTSLPFGFRGLEVLKTNDVLNDFSPHDPRIVGLLEGASNVSSSLSGSILPPIPFRYKATKGITNDTALWEGQPAATELANSQLYWGVKFERNTVPLNPNVATEKNELLASLTKFLGIKKLDVLVTGSGADTFNNNKFTLAKVALAQTSLTDITASINEHMREAAYIRNAVLDTSTYTWNDGVLGKRLTLASILASDTPSNFNRFAPYTKFVTFLHGGYDGLNFLDPDARRMNDQSTSFDAGGGATTAYVAPGLLVNPNGTGQSNSNVASYKTAVNIMTDALTVNTNILAIPGIRESYLTEYAAQKTREYGLAYYVMDIPSYDDDSLRLYDTSVKRPNVDNTATQLDTRAIDNNYVGVYFPNVYIDDDTNKRRVKVPSSVAALGALAFNDRVAYPWFAPAGFNRAALDFVKNVEVRLSTSDRDRLQESRINPIATFPRLGFVIYGQKTLQVAKSSLDRVNVRRLLLEVKRIVIGIAQKLVFENNTPDVRNKFVADASQQLGLIQAQAGIEEFRVICNETNNTAEDVNLNRMNGRIVVVPTRSVEFIALDFIVKQSGVTFV